jgi:trans-aconitate methyltransferase
MAFHGKRAAYLLRLLAQLPVSLTDSVLDVGRSPLTNVVLDRYPAVTTLGLPLCDTLLDKADPLDEARVPHVVFDLNQCFEPSRWVVPGAYKVLLFNEVIEHLRVSPGWVFRYLRELMMPGGFLIVQTPNAVSFGRRVRMISGRNPYMEFALTGEAGAHHFREYTKAELLAHAAHADLHLYAHYYVSYFPAKSAALGLANAVASVWPSLRNGQTLVLQRPL